MSDMINKTMELSDLDSDKSIKIIEELNNLVKGLYNKGLKISSWQGRFDLSGQRNSPEVINRGINYRPIENSVDDKNFPWFLYWEIVWVTLNAEFKEGQKILDLGGSSSLFSYYLASKGLDVTTVDLQEQLVSNANLVSQHTGWNLKNYVMNMTELDFDSQFDHISSICVFEHIPMYDRVVINKSISKLLVPHGRFSITFDYNNPSRLACIDSPEEINKQFVIPSGLSVRGNQRFFDSGSSYLLHPFFYPKTPWRYKLSKIKDGDFNIWQIFRSNKVNDYTFGALFLEKQ